MSRQLGFPHAVLRWGVVIWVLVATLWGCARPEESVTFNDAYLEHHVIEQMRKEKISFRRVGHTIWYKHRESDEVTKIFDRVLKDRPLRYDFARRGDQQEFVRLLRSKGIENMVSMTNEGIYSVYVGKEKIEIAQEIFRNIGQ